MVYPLVSKPKDFSFLAVEKGTAIKLQVYPKLFDGGTLFQLLASQYLLSAALRSELIGIDAEHIAVFVQILGAVADLSGGGIVQDPEYIVSVSACLQNAAVLRRKRLSMPEDFDEEGRQPVFQNLGLYAIVVPGVYVFIQSVSVVFSIPRSVYLYRSDTLQQLRPPRSNRPAGFYLVTAGAAVLQIVSQDAA